MSVPTVASFRRSLAGTPMAAEAGAIYKAAIDGGLNPAFVAGLASAESSFGAAGYARGSKNPYGLGVHLGWKFPTYAQATSKLASTLKGLGYPDLYKQRGLAGIISQYTPASDGNNEQQHARNIIAGGRRTGGDASQVYLNGRPPVGAGATFTDPATTTTTAALSGNALGPEFLQSITDYFGKARESINAGKDVLTPEGHQTFISGVLGKIPKAETLAAPQAGAAALSPGAQGAVDAAKRWIGTPYSWGGGSTSGPTKGIDRGANTVGFDCSSLVQYAWAKAGVKIPRVTYDQMKIGQRVSSLAQAQPGDLLFPHAGHVQMYLGNGKVIEAPQTGGHVRITNARSSYMTIRRPG